MYDLLTAYANAIFPMADPDTGEIHWYSPDPRAVIPLDTFHVPKNLARLIRQKKFVICCNSEFEQVMRYCAQPRSEDNGSWMVERLLAAYVELHQAGYAHSIEAWKDDQLVGGLYGVQLGGAFFGESMFSLPDRGGSNASKVCLVYLVRWMRHRGFRLLDTQFVNNHLLQFGVAEIPRAHYITQLQEAINMDVTWGNFACLDD